MVNLFTELLILCILMIILCSCKNEVNNNEEFYKELFEEREEQSVLYSILPVKNVISKNETAIFTGEITNNAHDDYFLIEINNSNFLFESFSVQVAKNDTTVFVIHIKPNSSIEDCKTYFLPLTIKSKNSGFYIVEKEEIAIFISDDCHWRTY